MSESEPSAETTHYKRIVLKLSGEIPADAKKAPVDKVVVGTKEGYAVQSEDDLTAHVVVASASEGASEGSPGYSSRADMKKLQIQMKKRAQGMSP